jgi:hypothetical protein
MRVYISHASSDSLLARTLASGLEEAGLDVWRSEEHLYPGENWARAIDEGLRGSNAMIVLLTPDSIRSQWVLSEASFALSQRDYKDRFIPVVIGDPALLPREEIPWIFKKFNLIELQRPHFDEHTLHLITERLKNAEYSTS